MGAFNEDGLEDAVEMKVGVRAREFDVGAAVKSHVQRRLLFALARFGGRIQDVIVHLTVPNGSRGGFEKSCRMTARLVPWGAVRVERADDALYAAINHAADRLGMCVARELARRGRRNRPARVGVDRGW